MTVERDIPVELQLPGQRVVVRTKGELAIAKASVGSSRQTSTVTASGKWVPPVDLPPPDTAGPVISNVAVDQITAQTARVRWALSEPGTGQVRYGTTPALGSVTPKATGLSTSQERQLIGLTANTQYFFAPVSSDAAGNETLGAMQVFATLQEIIVIPPIVGVPSGQIVITTHGTVIDGKDVRPGTYGNGAGIRIMGTKADPIRDVVIKRSAVLDGYNVSLLAEHVVNLKVEDCPKLDGADYAGILGTSWVGGHIKRVGIHHVGDARQGPPWQTNAENNAYGVALSNYSGDPVSSAVLVQDVVVEDVPLWHLFDTHNGKRITFERCIGRRGPRAMFITASMSSPEDVIVRDCQFLEARTKSGGTNPQAVTLYLALRAQLINTTYSGSYTQPLVLNCCGGGSTWTESGTKLLASGQGFFAALHDETLDDPDIGGLTRERIAALVAA